MLQEILLGVRIWQIKLQVNWWKESNRFLVFMSLQRHIQISVEHLRWSFLLNNSINYSYVSISFLNGNIEYSKILNSFFEVKKMLVLIRILSKQKQPSRGVLTEMCSENMQQIFRRHPCRSVISIKLHNHTSA